MTAIFMVAMALLQSDGSPADGKGGAGAQLIDRLAACRAVVADDARLACYDRAAGAVVEARSQKDIVVLDRGEIRKAKRSLFGFSLPSIKLFGDGQDDEQLKQMVGVIRSATPLTGGLVRFEVEDGGVWEATEQVMLPPRRGDVLTIRPGSLGGYIATSPGRRSVRVRRVR